MDRKQRRTKVKGRAKQTGRAEGRARLCHREQPLMVPLGLLCLEVPWMVLLMRSPAEQVTLQILSVASKIVAEYVVN